MIEFSFQQEHVINLTSFKESKSVTADEVFSTAVNSINQEPLKKVHSVMADTSINTGDDKRIHSGLAGHFNQVSGHQIHVPECQFYVNEILLSHAIKYTEVKPTAPDRMSPELVYYFVKVFKARQSK